MTPEEMARETLARIDEFAQTQKERTEFIAAAIREAVEAERRACIDTIESVGELISENDIVEGNPDKFHYGAGYAVERAVAAIEARSNTEEVDVWDAKEVSSHHE